MSITDRAAPFQRDAGIAVLRGNLAPGGALIKPAAASPHLLKHRGRAVVFDSIEDFHARIDDPDLDVDADSVLVLRGCGPMGYPGMPEVSNMPLPQKLLEQGVRDMVRICDGRMSGTAYGTVVLHVTPEAAAGGPLGLIRTGDWVSLDVRGRRIDVELTAEELAARGPSDAMVGRVRQPAARVGAPLRRSRDAGRHGCRPRLPAGRQRVGGQPRVALTVVRGAPRSGHGGCLLADVRSWSRPGKETPVGELAPDPRRRRGADRFVAHARRPRQAVRDDRDPAGDEPTAGVEPAGDRESRSVSVIGCLDVGHRRHSSSDPVVLRS